jgi:microcystin-dependent protein
MSDFFIGEIRVFSFPWAPRGWALCNGANLKMQQNQALYALIGVQFGHVGNQDFNLPDLRGRVPAQAATLVPNGMTGGLESVPLNTSHLPQHNHAITAQNAAGTAFKPVGLMLAKSMPDLGQQKPRKIYGGTGTTARVYLNPATIGPTGASAPHPNMQPYLAINFCIATMGLFPTRP